MKLDTYFYGSIISFSKIPKCRLATMQLDSKLELSKNAKICITPNAKPKICVTTTQTPNARRWNIGCVGSPTQRAGSGHVDFSFQWNGLYSKERIFYIGKRYVVLCPVYNHYSNGLYETSKFATCSRHIQ